MAVAVAVAARVVVPAVARAARAAALNAMGVGTTARGAAAA